MAVLRFGDFSLDTQNRELRRGDRVISVQRKVLACLELFANNPGQLLDDALLRERLWPDASVSSDAVRRLIREARRALGDGGQAQSLIRTRRGLGYVFIAPVARLSSGRARDVSANSAWPFVGRDAHLSELRQTLVVTPVGGVFCLISGEAGAGKSRLLAELHAQLPAGRRWFTGYCQAGEQSPSFWPWRELLRSLLASREYGASVRAAIKRERALPSLFPELVSTAGVVSEAPSAEHRFDVCDAFVRVLRRVSAAHPLLVVIEDVHWADEGSVLLLEMLARCGGAGIVDLIATCRVLEVNSETPLGRALTRMIGRVGVKHIELHPLTLPDVRRLIASVHPARDTLETAHAVHRLSGGNPLFAEQLLKHQLVAYEGGSLPGTLQQVVLSRVAPLPNTARGLLESAAVLGAEFSVAELAVLARCTAARLCRELQPALELGVIHEPRVGTLAFSHALLRDALYAAIDAARRRSLHRDTVRMLGKAQCSARASHAFLAGDALPASRTRGLCEHAGRQAFDQLAFDRAALHLGRALSLLEPDCPARRRVELTLLWARARWHTGEPAPAVRAAFLQAAELARAAGATRAFAEAAIGFAVGEDSVLDLGAAGDRRAEIALLSEAALRVRSSDRSLRHRVARALCWLCEVEGDTATAMEQAAVALRTEPSKPDAWARTLTLGMRLSVGRAAYRGVIAECEALRRDSSFSPRQRAEMHLHAMVVSLVVGDMNSYGKSRRELEQLSAVLLPPTLERVGSRLARCLIAPHAARATQAIIAGELESAAQCMREAMLRVRSLELPFEQRPRLSDLAQLFQMSGYLAARGSLLRLLDSQADETPSDAFLRAIARAECAIDLGEPREAAVHYHALRATHFQRALGSALYAPSRANLIRIADLCAQLGTASDATILYRLVLPMADMCACDGVLVSYGAAARALGELSSQLGEFERAERHLRAALVINTRAQHRPERARTMHALAFVLGRLGRHRQARQATQTAQAEARAMKLVLREPAAFA